MGILNKLTGDDRAVSPVIGVVLMVAVVVILAAVIGAFVLGLGGNQQAAQQASFSYSGGTLTMESGESIDAGTVYVQVNDGSSVNKTISGGTSAGDPITGITASDGDTIRVIDGQADSTIWQTEV